MVHGAKQRIGNPPRRLRNLNQRVVGRLLILLARVGSWIEVILVLETSFEETIYRPRLSQELGFPNTNIHDMQINNVIMSSY